jgi:cell wall-associated NlpC family hydrolase
MKKQKPNASFIILVALFILTQATFAFSGTLFPQGVTEDKAVENNEILAIDDNAELLATNDAETSMDTQELKELAAETLLPVIQNSVLASASKVPETSQTALAAAATETTQAALEAQQAATEPKKEIKPVVRYVNANTLNVRESPSSESKLITTIGRGDKVTYYETEGEWARIITWTDKKGYILAKYLVDSEKDVQKVEKKTTTSTPKKTSTVSRSGSDSAASSEPPSAEAQSLTEQIIEYAKSLQGVKYVHGGYSTKSLDCSGFTKFVFAKFGISLPRSSSAYSGVGTKVSRSDIRAGDILLFDGWGNSTLNHVGIYIGNGQFIHASTTKGKVVIQDLNSYRGTYLGARRVIK